MKRQYFLFLALFSFAKSGWSAGNEDTFQVEKVLDNGYYIINGVAWQPHTSCKTLKKGDDVRFVEGNIDGECVSATIIDLNSQTTCKLWCKANPIDN
ncbi:MAG: hypothetical protein AB7V32_02855 [Candidatus Berkiella sp.]